MEASTVRVETSAATSDTAPVSHLFLCYAREDAAFCDALVAALRRNGISVQWDRNLSPALDYADQIRALIRSSDAFAVILSQRPQTRHNGFGNGAWDLPRETRSADEMAELVSKLTPFCLAEGKLGKWSPPASGADRGACIVQ